MRALDVAQHARGRVQGSEFLSKGIVVNSDEVVGVRRWLFVLDGNRSAAIPLSVNIAQREAAYVDGTKHGVFQDHIREPESTRSDVRPESKRA
jgi:hypothetical protein